MSDNFLGMGHGGTKDSEYRRTIQILIDKTGLSGKDVSMLLYFLHDSQYNNEDLKAMAEIALKDNKKK